MFRQRKTSIKQRILENLLKLCGKLGGWKMKVAVVGRSFCGSCQEVDSDDTISSINIYQNNNEE